MELIYFIALCCSVILFSTQAQIIQDIKSIFHVSNTSEFKNPLQYYILQLINCSMCSGFWFGLIFYKSFLLACLVSICSEVLDRIINKI